MAVQVRLVTKDISTHETGEKIEVDANNNLLVKADSGALGYQNLVIYAANEWRNAWIVVKSSDVSD